MRVTCDFYGLLAIFGTRCCFRASPPAVTAKYRENADEHDLIEPLSHFDIQSEADNKTNPASSSYLLIDARLLLYFKSRRPDNGIT